MPLVHYNCSRNLRFFLCSVFAPVCSEHVAMQIPACKPLCLSVRRDCEPALSSLSLPWPHMLDCDRFPDGNKTPCLIIVYHFLSERKDNTIFLFYFLRKNCYTLRSASRRRYFAGSNAASGSILTTRGTAAAATTVARRAAGSIGATDNVSTE